MLQTGSLRTVEIFVQASIDLPKEGDDNSETIPARFRPHQFHAQAVNEGWAVRSTLSAVFPLLIVISLLGQLPFVPHSHYPASIKMTYVVYHASRKTQPEGNRGTPPPTPDSHTQQAQTYPRESDDDPGAARAS